VPPPEPPQAPQASADAPRFDPRADPPSVRPAPPPAPVSAPPSPESRLLPLERMINDNDWRAVREELGPIESAGSLPPNLALLAAIAHRETSEESGQKAIAVGVQATAKLLAVAEDGAIAGVVARRLLRTNPVRFRDRKAPAASVSLLIVLVTLVLGGTLGWLLSGGWSVLRNLLR